MSTIPMVAVILRTVDGKPQRERMPSRRRIAQAMATMTSHPVFPAHYPLRDAAEDDGPFAILGKVYDLHIPVRKVGDKEVRAIAGWHMPFMCDEAHPLGPPADWPLDAQFLEPLDHAISFDRVVFTATAPTIALNAWRSLARDARRAHEAAGVHPDAAESALEEAVAAISAAMNRHNPTIKRIAQEVFIDLSRGLVLIGASGAARDAAREAVSSLLTSASLPEDALSVDPPDVRLRPLNMHLWLSAVHFNDHTMGTLEWTTRFGIWLLQQMRGGPLYVVLREPDRFYRVHFGNRMTLTTGEGRYKQKVQAQLKESRREHLVEVVESVAQSAGMEAGERADATFELELATPGESDPTFLTMSEGAVIDIDVDIKSLATSSETPEAGTMEATTQHPWRLSEAADRGLRAAAIFEAFSVMEVLWGACFDELRERKLTTIPSVSDPSYVWPLAPRGGVFYTEQSVRDAAASDRLATVVRKSWGLL